MFVSETITTYLKMSDVCARLEERQRARLAALEQKKAQEREGKREEETFEYFSRELEARKTGRFKLS